jgi:hypothetical protein
VRFSIPVRLPSLANTRLHWRAMASLKKKQKKITQKVLDIYWTKSSRLPLPLLITLTRVGPRRLDKHDNLPITCKYVVDQIAATIGVDDGSDLYTWRYEQRIGKYSVEVEITSR